MTTQSPDNPYVPPASPVSDTILPEKSGFIRNGRKLPAGRGTAWLGEAWEMFKQSPGTWIGLVLVAVMLIMASSFVSFLFKPLMLGAS